jgi:nucleoside phosphorylase
MIKKIIVVEPDGLFINMFKSRLAAQQLDGLFEIIQIDPTAFSLIEEDMVSRSLENVSELIATQSVHGVFVDISFNDEINDNLGIRLANLIKNKFLYIPVFCITNKTKSEVDYNNFCLATAQGLDGVFIKRFLCGIDFSKKKFDEIFELAYQRIAKYKSSLVPENYDTDVAILTALHFELKAFERLLNNKAEMVSKANLIIKDTTAYYRTQLQCSREKINLIYATEERMGMPSITSLASRMIINFRPKYLIIIGIAAGVPDETKIGDLLITSNAYNYGSGKLKLEKTGAKNADGTDLMKEIFIPYGDHIALEEQLRNSFIKYKTEHALLQKLKEGFELLRKYDFSTPEIHLGPFASGAAVIANENVVNSLLKNEGKLIGFDMEAYGVFAAARTLKTFGNSTKPISIKAVADFGDSHKSNPNKELFQSYAAHTSANFLFEYLINEF